MENVLIPADDALMALRRDWLETLDDPVVIGDGGRNGGVHA